MRGELLDDLRDASTWTAVASGQARLAITSAAGSHGAALRLEFDFRGGGGFVVARKPLRRSLPASWALDLRLRGDAPANRLEVKLADPSGRNVWWWHRDAFELPHEWRPLRIRSSEVEFAWGPAGGGALRELGALEVAIAAGPGGAGTLWIEDLRLEDLETHTTPRVRASSAQPGCAPECVLDDAPTSWRSAPGAGPQWLALDFGAEREYGGLVVDWAPGATAAAFAVESSPDGISWETLWSAQQAEGPRSYVYLPGGASSRHLRLHLLVPAAGADCFGIAALDVRPHEFGRSLAEFFHAVAANERPGSYPKWLRRVQTYWSPVGVEGGRSAAILNEEGMFEPDRASFSLEPFLWCGGELVTWADASVAPSLALDSLPIPSSTWRHGALTLVVSAYATDSDGCKAARARYRIENGGTAPQSVRLFAVLRPFQVTPPWQAYREMGGTSPIHSLVWRDGAVEVNGGKQVVPLSPPLGFGAAAFEQGGALRHLARGELPPRNAVGDPFGHAEGALAWDFELPPGATAEVHVAVPFAARLTTAALATLRAGDTAAALDSTLETWSERLGRVEIDLPESATACIHTLRTATAHILVNRDGDALQPGPRRYTRSWIRDGATMAAALLRMGCAREARDFVRWYAPYQAASGNVPCVVDRDGADWLPEHDSHGQLAFVVAEVFRFTGDLDFAREQWPAVLRAVDYLEALREQRCGEAFRSGERKACYGILPESASHEGYLAHPVHSYWDDFWAVRGLGDAIELADALGDAAQRKRLAALRDSLSTCLYASIAATREAHGLAYVPGSVEWADFDPTATATAIATTDAAQRLPAAALDWMYDEYLAGLRRRRRGEVDWNNYSAYEIRNLAALVRLGRRGEAHELLEFFLADRRPRAWNQWPEISWRDPHSPGHLGDLPHAWIGAEFVLALLGMFAYERVSDAALVLAAGVSADWLDAAPLSVRNLPTWWGPLSYTLRRAGDHDVLVEIAPGLRPPPGGIVVQPPLSAPLYGACLEGGIECAFDSRGATVHQCPATVRLRCRAVEGERRKADRRQP